MRESFHVFGPVHVFALAMVPVLGAALAGAQRRFPGRKREFRFGLAVLLLACTTWYYGSFVAHGERLFPFHLPLELCDLSLWLTIFTLLRVSAAAFDVAYYWAVAGAGMALLTPNLVRPSLVDELQFFSNHGLVVAAVLYLAWSGQARPRRGSMWRALIAVNVAAVLVGAFDYGFKTDYMFLCTKPPTVSLLDVFGPWPVVHPGVRGGSGGAVLAAVLAIPGAGDGSSPVVAERGWGGRFPGPNFGDLGHPALI